MIAKPYNTQVLIVEDNEFNARFLKVGLDSLGAVCDIAQNGQIALEMARVKNYDIIFMDCQMPVMDGYTATMNIRKLSKPFCDTPIIAISANAVTDEMEKCIASGMNDCLEKPVELSDLEEIFAKFRSGKANSAETISDVNEMFKRSVAFEEAVENLMIHMRFFYEQASDLMEEYVKSVSKIILKMELAAIGEDYDEISRLAHQIKGISCNMRLKEYQRMGTEIEKMSKNRNELVSDEIIKLKHIFHDDFGQ